MPTARWKKAHERYEVNLSSAEAQHLRVILAHTSMESLHDWLRTALRAWSSRIPESQGKVRIELDPERDGPMMSRAQEILAREGHGLHEAWKGEPNPERRAEIRRRAAMLLDDAAHLSTILEKLEERRHVMEEGLKAPRHRYVDATRRRDSHSPNSPSRRNQSK